MEKSILNLKQFFQNLKLKLVNSLSERSEVKRDGAKAQKNSGRGNYQKGDAQWNNFLVDYKEASKSFTLNKDVWSKICTDTFKVNRDMHPALKIIIGENSKVRLGIIEWSILEELIQCWEDNNV
jgi:hypothetical protein